jgi:hypothetical protein
MKTSKSTSIAFLFAMLMLCKDGVTQSLDYSEIEHSFGDSEDKEALLKKRGFKLIERTCKSVNDTCHVRYRNATTKEELLYEYCLSAYYNIVKYTCFNLLTFNRQIVDRIPRSYILTKQTNDKDWKMQSYDSKSYFVNLLQYMHAKGYNLVITMKIDH